MIINHIAYLNVTCLFNINCFPCGVLIVQQHFELNPLRTKFMFSEVLMSDIIRLKRKSAYLAGNVKLS